MIMEPKHLFYISVGLILIALSFLVYGINMKEQQRKRQERTEMERVQREKGISIEEQEWARNIMIELKRCV